MKKTLKNSRNIVLLTVVGLGSTGAEVAGQGTPSPLWGPLDPGPYAVGFSHRFVADDTRDFDLTEAGESVERPIRLLLWYPADSGEGPRLSFGDYVRIDPDDGRFADVGRYLEERDMDTAARQFSPASPAQLEQLMETEVPPVRNARAAAGAFPLLVHSLGRNNFQQESTVLWEYLASHGYVVAVVPQLGRSMTEAGLAFSPADVRLQAADVSFALDHLTSDPRSDWIGRLGLAIDAERVGLVGHSSGGVVGLLLALEDRRVGAVAGLDGSFGTSDGAALFEEMGLDLTGVETSILNLYARAKGDLDLGPLDAMSRSDRFHIAIGGTRPPDIATHFDFQNWPLYSVLTGVEDERGVGARPAVKASIYYRTACRLTRRFFDHVLGEDRSAREFLIGAQTMPEIDRALLEYRATGGASRQPS